MAELNLRRLRQNSLTRELTREFHPDPKKMIQPHFIVESLSQREPIKGLTDVYRETPDSLLRQVESDLGEGVDKILLFGVPQSKSDRNFNFDFTSTQISNIKKRFGKDIWVGVDVCLCSHTTHGHCGILNDSGDHLLNSASVEVLAQQALAYAQAGADCVAPSDMMDGRIKAIRDTLSDKHLDQTLLMSYAIKFHSRFYGPFREAADSAPKGEILLKNRATYQIDPGRLGDALLSAERDFAEGADILMVKPGLPYLDILFQASQKIKAPWAVYQVSGEFASIELMAEKGLIQRSPAHVEAWTAFTRAGAQIIITYGARHARKWIQESEEHL